MVLCHCNGVNDRTITCAITCGAGTLDEVAAACGAGDQCRGCVPAIEALLDAHRLDALVPVARTA